MQDSNEVLGLSQATEKLNDIGEPDPEFFRAQEAEPDINAPRRALVVLVTDIAPEPHDNTDRLMAELLNEGGFVVDGILRVPAEHSQIRNGIEAGVIGGADLVVTIGGTGVGPRDQTPEATRDMLDQAVPGIAQALRSSGLACGSVDACTSRGISGVSGSTVVVNLASSRAAIRDGMATLTPLVHHLVDQLRQAEVH
ncbi:MAG: MogA/MoaB family molybdenum cofactor biosynthesis protein [Corynebacterium sp.]|uniref:MogA/MoaB family molybdenum cofactor biosynthesis protein n=1 Tax=Corynebacterium sp. TaxID=1720 RepID=UPI0026DACCFA|nr:MogA/MoaB family molybdenum cofactor biosynthesis protein [Corynebacterium sp.]MDO4761827.1 MogA/MoaB family molybdenum cofactor biosynthesis protein [Corynebacterium sp.]